jgi:hypothetical protein
MLNEWVGWENMGNLSCDKWLPHRVKTGSNEVTRCPLPTTSRHPKCKADVKFSVLSSLSVKIIILV